MTARWNNLPVRCKCGHSPSAHSRREGMCWTHPCACQQFRDKAEWDAAEARHPAGRDLPQTADIEDYLRAKGEIQ